MQFTYANYSTMGAVNRTVNLAPANRAELLVKPPVQPGLYTFTAQPNAENSSDPNKPCYVDHLNPQTWKPCTPLTAP